LNRVPESCRHIHVMGICGTGMAALAGMLKEQGYQITGSDENVYPPMSDFLADLDIKVMAGYGRENLNPVPDLVVVGNVIRAVNSEAEALVDLQVPYVSMPQALGHFFLAGHLPLVVAGTHGKTTTSSLLATALHRAGASPGFMIGGIVEAFGRNFRLGKGDYFVVEGDEYDTAFFNKVSKFLHYRPYCALLTSIEFDHADIFPDLAAIKTSFAEFVTLIPAEGVLVACMDDPVVAEIAGRANCPVLSYGCDTTCLYQLRDLQVRGLSSEFSVYKKGQKLGRFTLPLPGLHNGLNGTAVIALMDHLGFSLEAVAHGLATFEGVKRRQQIRGEIGGVTVIDDFAHHPTAVRETVNALRLAWPDRRLVTVFEPRTNSSRRSIFQDRYAEAFDASDMIVVREHVPLADVPVSEQFSSARLVQDLELRGANAHYFSDTESILDFLVDNVRPGDIVAILSNGGFDNIHQRLLSRLE
ncbi:MAG TPA: UDP-N-acetylmuramate:L-alanyl-gamma-D-glutamyl-meso-diaminopimelate ligase, partial [Desulfobulbaceae bacterium]|nr:UDP-N-acetylmuramate:L-alanyl-gamma-D-glutamyl-meso-diaminopimelate ligase [Desulfobulbaceae bacterium]